MFNKVTWSPLLGYWQVLYKLNMSLASRALSRRWQAFFILRMWAIMWAVGMLPELCV
jgi:hypothetical protein